MTSTSLHYFERLLALLQSLASDGIEVESHRFDAQVFGSFVLTLVKGHTRAHFIWDGKESLLTVEYQRFQNKGEPENWVHDAFIQVPSAESVFAEIGSNALAILL